jgi:riboflavin biosynthesis pyrimidine reductase
VLEVLKEEFKMESLMVEGGSSIINSMIMDESVSISQVVITISPQLVSEVIEMW